MARRLGVAYFHGCHSHNQENEKTFLVRNNGDGSQGTYELTQSGNTYVKVGDKFGAYYVLESDGLHIYELQGYIRTAKKK